MKDKTKKLISGISIVTILTIGLFGTAANSQETVDLDSWKNEGIRILQIGNYTKDGGTLNWKSGSVSADGGDIIAFLVHCHNFTSGETANNVKISATVPSSASQTQNVSVSLWADNSFVFYDSAAINISTSQTATFIPGSVQWFPKGQPATPLPFSQSGDSIISSGVNVGDVLYGNSESGYLTFKVQLSNVQPTPSPSPGVLPSITTLSAQNISFDSATIRGSADPNGLPANAWFEWGASSDGLTSETSHQDVGSGTYSIDFLAGLSGLSQNTVYFFRAVAENSNGIVRGSTKSFTTKIESTNGGNGGGGGGDSSCLAIVTTKPASFITKDSASLRALINPNGRSTSGWFEYGQSYALTFRTTSIHVGSGTVDTDLLRLLSDLNSNTTYYFRAVAENNCGKVQGSILSFTTEVGIQPLVVLPATPTPTPIPSPQPTPSPHPSGAGGLIVWKEIKNLTFPNGTVRINASFIGDTLEYYLNVKNVQSTELKDILVKDIIDRYFEFIESNPEKDSISSGDTLYWKIASLKPGETKTITYRIKTKKAEESVVIPNLFRADSGSVSAVSNEATTILNPCLMALDISSDKTNVKRNETYVSTIRYRNIGIADVDNVLLKVSLPSNVVLEDVNRNYDSDANVLFFNIGRLNKNESGTIDIKMKVSEKAEWGENLVTTAVLDFTDIFNDPQPNISVSSVVVVESGFFGVASALGLSFGNLNVWLLMFLIVILAFIFGIFYLRYKIAKTIKA